MSFPLKLLLMPTQNFLHSETCRIYEVSSQKKKKKEYFWFVVGTTCLFLSFRPSVGISLIAQAVKIYYILPLIFLNDCPKWTALRKYDNNCFGSQLLSTVVFCMRIVWSAQGEPQSSNIARILWDWKCHYSLVYFCVYGQWCSVAAPNENFSHTLVIGQKTSN